MRIKFFKILVCLVLILSPGITFSQDLIQEIADKVCDCFEQKKVTNYDDAVMRIGFCLLESADGSQKKLKKKYDVDLSSKSGVEQLGKLVGIKMAVSCPSFVKMVSKEMVKPGSPLKKIVNEKLDANSKSHSITGVLTEIREKQFATLIVKEADGRTHELNWLEYFPGSDPLIQDMKAYQDKTLEVTYEERELFIPSQGGYLSVKVIISIIPKD